MALHLLHETRRALRRIIPGLSDAWLRSAILRTAEAAAGEGLGQLGALGAVIHEHGERLTDQQLEGVSDALAVDLPFGGAVDVDGMAEAVMRAMSSEGGGA